MSATHVRPALVALLALLGGCGGEPPAAPRAAPEPAAATQPDPAAPVAPAGVPAAPPPGETRFACASDEDCTLDCALGAVSLRWLSELPPRAVCEDGCAGPDSGAPRCEDGACVATHRDGTPMPECTARVADVHAAEPMLVEVEGLTRGQSSGTERPNPYVMLRVHNPTDGPARFQLLAAAIWVTRASGAVALPVEVEAMELHAPEDPSTTERVAWLEHATLPAGATRDVTVHLGSLDAAPPHTFPYRVRITLRDEQGRMTAVDAGIQRVIRHPWPR